jgi:hypothetical protein
MMYIEPCELILWYARVLYKIIIFVYLLLRSIYLCMCFEILHIPEGSNDDLPMYGLIHHVSIRTIFGERERERERESIVRNLTNEVNPHR